MIISLLCHMDLCSLSYVLHLHYIVNSMSYLLCLLVARATTVMAPQTNGLNSGTEWCRTPMEVQDISGCQHHQEI